MRIHNFLYSILVSGLLLAACSPAATPALDLNNTRWQLETLNGQPALSNTVVTLAFADGTASGSDGCNLYSTTYTSKGDKLSLDPMIQTTLMACEDQVMQQAAAFFTVLVQTTGTTGDDLQLTLTDAGGKTLAVFKKEGEPVPTQVSILSALPNAEYLLETTSTGKARLQNGAFEEPAAPGSSALNRVLLGDLRAAGDVNGDGSEDAAVVLTAEPGGSGTFSYLAVVLNEAGNARPITSVLLGDRIVVKSLAIQPGAVEVTLLNRAADEPLSAEPKIEETRTFLLQDGALVEMK